MTETIRDWFATRIGKRVRLTRRAAVRRDEVHEFAVDDATFRAYGDYYNVFTKLVMMCYGPPGGGALVLDGKLHCLAISGDGNHFFDVYEDAYRGVNQLANARLIAAAPELLDALKDMVDIFSRNVEGRPGRDDAAECWDRARDAIAKAEGRT